MPETPKDLAKPRQEAAAWFARLSRRAVTTESLREFRAWRQGPGHEDAYATVEETWARAGGLAEDPEIRAATLDVLRRRPPRAPPAASRAIWIGAAGGVLALLAAAILLPPLLQPRYATGVGEQRLVVLPDGSRVRLNTDSRIALRFGEGRRRVLLQRGEAFFEVAHDATRPFLVDAGPTDVRALGTRFDVRRTSDQVLVTLVQGSVRVTRDSGAGQKAAWILAPDQQLAVGAARPAVARTVDAAQAVSWTAGRLVFHETPLAQAVAEVNRYGRAKIVLGPGTDPGYRLNGVFETGDTDAFVAGLSSLLSLSAQRGADGDILLSGPDA